MLRCDCNLVSIAPTTYSELALAREKALKPLRLNYAPPRGSPFEDSCSSSSIAVVVHRRVLLQLSAGQEIFALLLA